MRILKFHGVGGTDYQVEALEAELKFLGRHFEVVPLRVLIGRVRGGATSGRREIALTFDDGLRNNYTVAYPLLKRLGFSATFFLCPGLIEGQRWLWNHEARERLRALPGERRAELARAVSAPASDGETFVAWMRTLARTSREGVEDAIRLATPAFLPTPQQRARFDVMTWDDVADMDPEMISVGAHTVTHPVLTSLDPGDVTRELQGSRQWLENRLGRPVEHFCYPYGAWNAPVAHEVRRWYEAAVTSEPGPVDHGDDLFGLRRISATPRLDLLAWRLHRPTA